MLETIAVGFRVDSGYEHPEGRRAVDVIDHERDVLGNNLEVSSVVYDALARLGVPATDLVWLCREYVDALRYSSDEMDTPEIIILPIPSYVIGSDDAGGVLVWKGANKVVAEHLKHQASISVEAFLAQPIDERMLVLADGGPLFVRDLLFLVLSEKLPEEMRLIGWNADSVVEPNGARLTANFEPVVMPPVVDGLETDDD